MKKKEIIDHELIPLLRSFTKEELKEFSLYLKSPFFTRRKALHIFYNELIKYHPLFTDIRLTKESLYRKVYTTGKKYNEVTIRDLFNKTVSEAKKYITLKSFEFDNYYPVYVLRQLRLRNQHQLFKNQIKRTNSILENYGGIDPAYFMLRFNLDTEKYNETVMQKKLTNTKQFLHQAKEISDSAINLIIYSVMEIVSVYITMLMRAEKTRVAQVDKFMVTAVNNLALRKVYEQIKGKSRYDFIVEIYGNLLNALITRGDWTAYYNFKYSVLNNIDKIGHNEASDLYGHLIQISILGTKAGDSKNEFDFELLKIYETYLKKKYFRTKKSNYIQVDLYRAIVFQAVKLNSIDWLKNLIKDSTPWLNPGNRENLLNYAEAYYRYILGDYSSSLDKINQVNLEYYLFKYDMYILKLKVFFDSGDYQPALDLILAFRKFISTDKLMQDERKINYRSFTNFLEKIIKISTGTSAIDADTLLLKFQKTNKIISHEWIGEKIQNLQKKIPGYRRFV